MERDALVAVAEDLTYLGEWGPEIGDPEIRRGSALLRRLLVEDAYGAAWGAIGRAKQPTLVAVHLPYLIGATPLADVVFGLAGGAHLRGIHMAGVMLQKGRTLRAPEAPPLSAEGYLGEKHYSLSEFLSSMAGIVDGHVFTRRDVIKYIANVKGGVHLSAGQRKSEEKLIARIQKMEKRIMFHTTDGLLIELVATGQALARSHDAKDYIASVHEF